MHSIIIVLFLVLAACDSDESGQDVLQDSGPDAIEEIPEEEAAPDIPEDEPVDGTGDQESEQEAPPSILDCGLESRSFWTWDLSVMPPPDIQVEADCRGWGPHVAVYVTPDQWEAGIDAEDVENIVRTFEESTPADPGRGIYDIVTSTFGPVPDVDGDERIVLLYHDLGEYAGSSFDGFFRAKDEGSCSTCNHTEMLFLDSVHNDPSGDYMLSIIPHEFQHMIQFGQDGDEASWVNETLSETAMILCGYYTDVLAVNRFATEPDTPLVVETYVDYGAAFLFGLYIYERFGESFVEDLAAEPGNSMNGFDSVAASRGETFDSVLTDWFLANFLDDSDLDEGQFGYRDFDTPFMMSQYDEPDGLPGTGTVQGTAADYLLYFVTGPDTLRFEFASESWASIHLAFLTYPEDRDPGEAALAFGELTASSQAFDIGVPAGHDRVTVAVYTLVPLAAPLEYTYSAQPVP